MWEENVFFSSFFIVFIITVKQLVFNSKKYSFLELKTNYYKNNTISIFFGLKKTRHCIFVLLLLN